MGKLRSRSKNDNPPTWSSWPCVAMQPSMRPALSRKYVKSGNTRSIPSMSMSGNIKPTSRSMMRPLTSMQAQLRPISPSPPRNVTTTGSGMEVGVHLSSPCLGAFRCRPERKPALPDAQPERAQHRLDRLREDTRVAVLEEIRLDQARIDLARAGDVALLEGADHLACLRTRPVRRGTHDTDSTDGQQGQRHGDVAAVDLEVWQLGDESSRCRRIAGGVLEGDDVGHVGGEPHEHV